VLAYPHVIVIVNGVTLAKDSEVLAVKAGQEIRFPVEEKGRLDQIEIEPRLFDPNQSN
jgi:N-acyl-D-glutamate deacylase